MQKLICSTTEIPNESIKHVISDFKEGDIPIILILSSEHAVSAALEQFKQNGYPPKSIKLQNMHKRLTPGGTLNVPWVEVSESAEAPYIKFSDGRHRSLALNEKNYKTIPVGTTMRHANKLRPFWGSVSISRSEYSFTDCHLQIIGLT